MRNKRWIGLLIAVLTLVGTASVLFGACGGKADAPQTYTITFAGGENATGSAPAAIEGKEGESVTLPANPFAKEGWTFSAWSDGAASYAAGAQYTVPARNVTMTATWAEDPTPAEQVTVTVKDGDATVATETMDKGGEYKLPAAPEAVEGKRFAGWTVGAEVKAAGETITVEANVEITAKWIEQVTVTVKDGDTAVATETLDKGGAYTLPAAPEAAEGKRFAGWTVGAEVKAAGETITIEANVEITAKWTDVYTVTFSNGSFEATGEVPAATEKAEGETLTMPAATGFARVHYTFAGWQAYTVTVTKHPITGADVETETKVGGVLQEGEVYTMTANTTRIKATWAANTVTIKFEGGAGATGSMPDESKEFGKSYFVPTKCDFVNGSKEFLGWTADGATLIDSALKLNKDTVPADDVIILTAVWQDSLADLVGVYETADGVKMLIAEDGTMIFDGKLLLTMDNSYGGWMAYDESNEVGIGALTNGKRTVSTYNYNTDVSETYEFVRTGDVVENGESVVGGYLRTQGVGLVDVPMMLQADGAGQWMLNATKFETSAITYELLGDYVIVYNGTYFYVMTRTADGLAGWYNNGAVRPVFKRATVRTLTMTANGVSKTQLVADGKTAVAWVPSVPEGQTFEKWVVKDTETVFAFSDAVTADLSIVAVFAKPIVTYSVKTASGNLAATGTAPVMEAAEEGASIVLPENPYTLTHNSFAGWQPCTYTTGIDEDNNPYETDTKVGPVLQPGETFTMIAQPIKFKATWMVNMVTIRFDGGAGATGEMKEEQKLFGKSYFLPAECGFTNGNKAFLGWSLNGVDLLDTAFPLNAANVPANDIVTLHAVWQENVAVPTMDELAGAWTGENGALDIDAATKAAVLNGKSYLSLELIDGYWYAYNDDSSEFYALKLSGSILTLTAADSTVLTFSSKAALVNADEAIFLGRFTREITGVGGASLQPLMLVAGGSGYLTNAVKVTYSVIGDYAVVKQFVSSSGGYDYYNYFVLKRADDALSGWLLQNEKAAAAVTFTESAKVFVLTADGVVNQIVIDGKAPLADKLATPTAPDGQKFDKWVVAETETEFDVSAVMTADVSIEARFVATASAQVFEGEFVWTILKKLVRISVNTDTLEVIYTTANNSGKETEQAPQTATIVNGAYKVNFNGENYFLKISDDGQSLNMYDYQTMDAEDLKATFTLAA